MKDLLDILKQIKPDVDFDKEKHLITSGVLDSFDIVSIIAEITETFGVEINVMSIVPENFESAEAIYDMIQSIED